MQVQYVNHFEAHDHSNNKKIIFLLNEYLFEWILVGNLLLPLFILRRLTDWSMYKWNSYFMLCHHAYLHGKSLTTIFSVVFCYMTLHYTSEKPLTPTGWLCISKWLPSSLHDCPSVNQSLCEPVNLSVKSKTVSQ